MTNKNKTQSYISKAHTTAISATSRVAVKIKDNYYTIEAHEERSLSENYDLDKEWELLWDSVNYTADTQISDILTTLKD